MHLNVEIKATSNNSDYLRQWLLTNGADLKGTDHQTDTYYEVPNGRLKLRQGNIENSLIFYERNNQAGPKDSSVTMTKVDNGLQLNQVLEKALGILVEVKKQREIYFIENVKFHVDHVPGLGNFIEIEAIDKDGSIGKEKLLEQCNYYMQMLGIEEENLQTASYSDMLMAKDR
ncbi:MAG: class IV adenylate cyclase [Bacteroidota bacterium]